MSQPSLRRWARETWLRRFEIRWFGYVATTFAIAGLLHFAYLKSTGDELMPGIAAEHLPLTGIAALLIVGVALLWIVAPGVALFDLLAVVTGVTLMLGLRHSTFAAFVVPEFVVGGFAWAARGR